LEKTHFESHVLSALARAGVKKIRIIDFDRITLSSLNRHAFATRKNVGISKVQIFYFCGKNDPSRSNAVLTTSNQFSLTLKLRLLRRLSHLKILKDYSVIILLMLSIALIILTPKLISLNIVLKTTLKLSLLVEQEWRQTQPDSRSRILVIVHVKFRPIDLQAHNLSRRWLISSLEIKTQEKGS